MANNQAPKTRFAAMVKFPSHMTEQECNDILNRMMKAGYCEPAYDNKAPTCKSYDENMSIPTLYFP